jgi:hypothetical protein
VAALHRRDPEDRRRLLLVAAIVNLLVGVFLRYVMIEVTDWLDVDSDPLHLGRGGRRDDARLAHPGRRGDRRARAQPLHPARADAQLVARAQSLVERVHHVLIAVFGAIAAWYGVKLCLLNRTLVTPGLEINLALLYASCVVGGVLLVVYAVSMIVAPPPIDPDAVH